MPSTNVEKHSLSFPKGFTWKREKKVEFQIEVDAKKEGTKEIV